MPTPVSLKLVTAPAVEPITRTEAKLHCRVDGTDEDTSIDLLIIAAREAAEKHTGRALITQTWDAVYDEACDQLRIPKGMLQSVFGVYVTNLADVESTVTSTSYQVITNTEPGQLLLKSGYVWPETRGTASFRIRFICGYGATAASVPASIRLAMLQCIAHWYAHRESQEMPEEATRRLNEFRLGGSIV